MKAFQRKQNIQNTHHDIQPVQAQFQSRPFAEPQTEGINAASTAYSAVKASGVLTEEDQISFGRQTREVTTGISSSMQKGENLASTEEIANLSKDYAATIQASPVLGLGGPIASLLVSIYNLYDSYTIKEALSNSLKDMAILQEVETEPQEKGDSQFEAYNKLEIKRNGKADDRNNDELKKSAKYGYAKVKRRFYGAIYDVVINIIDVVATVLTLTGVGAIAKVITTAAKEVINLVALAIRKIKGLYKILTGTRGTKRKLNAETIVKEALDGNNNALKLLVKLDPLGIAGRRIMGMIHAQKLTGIDKPENPEQMKQLLSNIKNKKCGSLTMQDFETAVAEQLKSF